MQTKNLFSATELTESELFRYIVNARGGVGLWMIKLGDAMSKYETSVAKPSSKAALVEDAPNIGDAIAVSFLKEWALSSASANDTSSSEWDLSSETFTSALDAALVRKLTAASGKMKEVIDINKGKGGPKDGFKASQAARSGGAASLEQNSVANLACRIIGVRGAGQFMS
jgi:hypothetical protein